MKVTAERMDDSLLDRRMLLTSTLGLATGIVFPAAGRAASERIDALLARMTIEEKAGQLSCFNDDVRPVDAVFNPVVNPRTAAAMLAEVRAGRVGMLFNGYGVAGARKAQDAALTSRLGIPLVFAADVIHGCRTTFPIPLAEAAAFDPDLSERACRAVAREASAVGLHWTFAPVVDIARDQRWGRVAEGAGEDLLLNRLLAAARVRGFQGRDLRADDALLATAKHFAGYSAVTGGMEYGAVDMSEGTLRELFLPPFAAAFKGGAGATIASFTTLNGIPVTANHWLLTRVLREEMGFTGVCVSDYDADRELVAHGVAENEADAAKLAITAGIDMSMQSGLYNRHLPALVAAGRVPMSMIDRSVRRVLALKEALGLFDNPFRSLDVRVERRAAKREATQKLARDVATRAIVLLRNEGDLLPLPRRDTRIALIGPFAADRANTGGPWTFAGRTQDVISIEAGIRALLADPDALTVEPGCAIEAAIPGGIKRAVALARASDVVLLAIGESAAMSGEGNSRVSITVPAPQQALAEALAATGKPIVVLLRHGRALALEGAIRDASALLATWFLGEQTGTAIADILFGVCEPTGRLPVSFPFSTGQQPWSYDRPATGRPTPASQPMEGGRSHWRDAPDRALYAFGSGLSYTRFALSNVKAPAEVLCSQPLIIQAEVTNTGSRPGTAFVRADLHTRVGETSPIRRMAGFTHVHVEPGKSVIANVFIPPDRIDYIKPASRGDHSRDFKVTVMLNELDEYNIDVSVNGL